ncbi:hypothetical protein Dsin_015662 [Dipteronia sinensis]|uniref:DDE Tnp4 domain-containing protein n=1 Tax=Dipteronia sinensis TaxID=43782 RepID=A0AAE0ABL8_9ROSI|nr:hypothetical protein Dsin_015662 [Dipteronia sinensis]
MDNSREENEIDQLICVCGRLIQVYLEKYVLKTPCMTSSQTCYIWLMEVLDGNESRSYNMFRIDKHAFVMLLNDVENIYKLKGSRNIRSPEILGMFLYILGQGIGNRNAKNVFTVPVRQKTLLGICRIPTNERFLEPYKCERYHLPHFRKGEEPTGHKEIFNHAHSSLRSIIEHIFGYRKRWSILRDMPSYSYEKQVKIVIATTVFHNYIRTYIQRDRDFDEIANYSSEDIKEEMKVHMKKMVREDEKWRS